MDILKQYDEYLTNNLDEIHDDVVYVNPIYRDNDCDWHTYMVDLYKYSIQSFIDWYQIDIQTIMPYRDDFKRTFNSNTNVINAYNSVKQLIIEHKLREIGSDFK